MKTFGFLLMTLSLLCQPVLAAATPIVESQITELEIDNSRPPNQTTATENSDHLTSTEQSQTIDSESLTKDKTSQITWGTSPVTITEDGRVATVGAGQLPPAATQTEEPSSPIQVRQASSIILEDGVKFPTNSQNLFAEFTHLEDIHGLEKIDTSHVTSMALLFFRCSALKWLDLSNFKTENVTDMTAMFKGCQQLISLDLSSFNTANVSSMAGMFRQCFRLADLNITSFDTTKVHHMGMMFAQMYTLKSLDLSHFKTTNCDAMFNMFNVMPALEELDLSSFDMSAMTSGNAISSVSYMLTHTPNLKKITFGPQTKLTVPVVNGQTETVGLDTLIETDKLTDKWINISTGTESHPKGTNIWTTTELEANYDGKRDADTYIRQRKDGQPVIVQYIDEKGKELAKADSLSGLLDAPYKTESKVIDGYTLKTTPDNATGVFTNQKQTVTYVYTKNTVPPPPGDIQGQLVSVQYIDENGKELAKADSLSGLLDAPYTTEPKVIDGYTLKTTPDNATGVFTNQKQTVTYVYTRKINKQSIDTQKNDKKTLPQTGEHSLMTILISLLGLLIIIFISLIFYRLNHNRKSKRYK